MERALLDILCCPVTRSPLEILSEDHVETIHRAGKNNGARPRR